ncbi:MAG: rhodanese-like domain-containing protein [Candidatus Doudnabacteria bacterium]
MKKQIVIGLIVLAVLVVGGIVVLGSTKNSPANQQVLSQPEIFVDVRTDAEWQAEHLNGAIHLDLAKIQQGQMPDLPKDAPIALYCHSGNRAGQALQILQKNGFTHIRNAGGLADLQSSGKKVCLGEYSSCN